MRIHCKGGIVELNLQNIALDVLQRKKGPVGGIEVDDV